MLTIGRLGRLFQVIEDYTANIASHQPSNDQQESGTDATQTRTNNHERNHDSEGKQITRLKSSDLDQEIQALKVCGPSHPCGPSN